MAIEIEDFSDLGKPITFKFNNEVFEIAPPTNKKSKELMKMGREINRDAKINEKKLKEYEGREEEIPQEFLDEMDKLFDFQIDFILKAGIKKLIVETNEKISPEKDELSDNWPNKLVSRIFRKVNESFTESEQEKKS